MNFPSPPSDSAGPLLLGRKIAALEAHLRAAGLTGDGEGYVHELLGAVFEAVPHFVAIMLPDGRLLYLNSAACQFAGVESADGHRIAAFFPPGQYERWAAEALAPHRRLWQGDIEWRGQGGIILPVALVAVVHRDKDHAAKFVSLLARDISHRRAAEEVLREQAMLLDRAHEAIVVKDLDDVVQRWSAGAVRIYGWRADEAVGRPASTLVEIEPEVYEAAKQATLASGNWSGEFTVQTRAGATLVVDSRWTLIADAGGRATGMLCIDSDITEQKRLERQMLRAQRMESIGALAGGIAHDLNNILAPIVMGVGLLQSKSPDPETASTLETMERSAARGADLVRQVLAFARGVEGKRGLVSPARLVRDVQTIVNETFPKSVAFVTEIAPDVGDVTGDFTQLHQVLLNLVVNARDAMPEGGIVTVGARNVSLDESYVAMHTEAHSGLHVVLSVTDTGAGIPPAILDKIFDPFFTTKDLGKGTGLGLSTAYAIVKGHGGFINVYSEVGRGTQMRVYLPAQRPGGASVAEPLVRELPRGHGEHVLVVDDEESVTHVVVRMLERQGYRATAARNGAEAIATYVRSSHPVDLVLTDMAMPVMDGPATVVALRSIDPGVRIIGASGLGSSGKFVHALGGEVRHFLQKPFTAESLLHALRSVLDTPREKRPEVASSAGD